MKIEYLHSNIFKLILSISSPSAKCEDNLHSNIFKLIHKQRKNKITIKINLHSNIFKLILLTSALSEYKKRFTF